jgi:cellulose synthase operon protein C
MSDPRKLPDDLTNADWDSLLDSFDEVGGAKPKAPSAQPSAAASAAAPPPPAPPPPAPAPESVPPETPVVPTPQRTASVPQAEPTPVDTHQVKTAPPPPILHEALEDPDDDRTRINAVPMELLESVRRDAVLRGDSAPLSVPRAPRVPNVVVPPPSPSSKSTKDEEPAPASIPSNRHMDFVEEEATSDLTRPDLTAPEGMEEDDEKTTIGRSPIFDLPDEPSLAPESLAPESLAPISISPAASAPPAPPAIPKAPPVPTAVAPKPPPVPGRPPAPPPRPIAKAPPPAPRAPTAPPVPARPPVAPVASPQPPVVAAPPAVDDRPTEQTDPPPAGGDFDLVIGDPSSPPSSLAPEATDLFPLEPASESAPTSDLEPESAPVSVPAAPPVSVREAEAEVGRVSAPPPLPSASTAGGAPAVPPPPPPRAPMPSLRRGSMPPPLPPGSPALAADGGSEKSKPKRAVAASARPLSEAPRPLPLASDTSFPDEREALMHLAELDTLDEYRERAIWLEEEARLTDDPAAKARGLLVASELRAMVGDDDEAAALADELLALTPQSALAHRQARAADVKRRTFVELIAPLDAEAKAVDNAAARLAAGALAAEISRVVLSDDAEGARRYDALVEAFPNDPRGVVDGLRRGLAVIGEVPAPHGPIAESLAPLAAGFAELVAARGGAVPAPAAVEGAENAPASTPTAPLAALAQARHAFGNEGGASDGHAGGLSFGGASDALAGLLAVRGVGPGAAWLGYALASATSGSRSKAIPILNTLLEGPDARWALRALTTVALQTGDAEAASKAVADEDAFSLGERAAFAALTGTAISDADAASLAADPELLGLSAAASILSEKGFREPLVGDAELRAAIATGRALAAGDDTELADRIEARDGPAYDFLRVDAAAEAGRISDVATAFAGWSHGEANDRDRALVASVLFDLAGEPDRAVAEARRIDVAGEVVARILLSANDRGALPMLQEVAETTEDSGRRALLLLETIVRREGEGEDIPDLLQAAHEASPDLPFPAALAARDARLRGDVDGLLTWLRLRRDGLEDPREIAFDNVREAMLIADSDLPEAVALLEQAAKVRPADVGLRDLLSRLSPRPAADRAEVLDKALEDARKSGTATPQTLARLALSAAWEFERLGDRDRAAELAAAAVEGGAGPLAVRTRDRVDFFGSGASRLAEDLMNAARNAEDPVAERAAFERLAYLDEVGRGDVASGLLWHRSILEKSPGWLPSLRKLEHALMTEGREEELEPIFAEIATATAGAEAVAHAQVSARLGARNAGWDTTRALVESAAAGTEPTVWALRQLVAHARAAKDDKAALRAAGLLAERTDRSDEVAALELQAGEAAFALGEFPRAQEIFEKSLRAFDGSVVSQLYLAETLRKNGEFRAAAEKLEETASLSSVPDHAARMRYDAAVLWLDHVDESSRGTQALEAAAEHDIGLFDIAERLQKLYIDGNERGKLADLLQRRLDSVSDPEERVALEVLRGRALAEVGDTDGAKTALAAALEASPDHVEALRAFAEVCTAESDWENVEQATIRLARLVPDGAEQTALYLRLGALYEERLDNPERAELSYREVLKRDPENVGATERVVALLAVQGNLDAAVELQTNLIAAAAADPAEKRRRSIALARLHEDVAKDVKKAEQMLEALRKEGPQDSVVLRALAEFHVRHNHGPAVNVLLDRTANDARRALTTGRFDLHFFANLGTVFELRGRDDAAEVANATVAALEGRPVTLEGIGARAARADLDDLLSPDIFTPAFRDLLARAGDALDAAVAVDLRGIKAAPLPPESASIVRDAQALAERFGFPAIEVLMSPTLGAVCLPASVAEPTLVFGAGLVDAPHEVRQYLTLRALGIMRARAAAFSRTPPIELWPLTAALLKCFVPTWDPPAADASKVADYKARIEKHLPSGLSLGAQAHEVIGTLGNKASTLQAAANSWGARVAFLAVGDLSVCLSAIATAAGQANQPPPGGQERMTWTGRNAEARDLAVFSVNDAYVEARTRGRG